MKKLSFIDQLLIGADQALRTVASHAPQPDRQSPATPITESTLDEKQQRHVAGLMRINHAGEICAQALYQGQALTANKAEVRDAMEHAAQEEWDHLAWCEERIQQMNSHTSHLNPLWYGLSFSIGALAGAISDRISLGFVAATEDQVCEHLQAHLAALPREDVKSKAILEQMLADEAQHAHQAMEFGGVAFPKPVKQAMTLISKVMTKTSYYL